MERFLDDRQDEFLMHNETMGQGHMRSRTVQMAVDKIDELGLAGGACQRKQGK